MTSTMPRARTARRGKPTREQMIQAIKDGRELGTLLDVHAVAFYLGQDTAWIYDQTPKGFPTVRLSPNKIAFRLADVDRYLASTSRGSVENLGSNGAIQP